MCIDFALLRVAWFRTSPRLYVIYQFYCKWDQRSAGQNVFHSSMGQFIEKFKFPVKNWIGNNIGKYYRILKPNQSPNDNYVNYISQHWRIPLISRWGTEDIALQTYLLEKKFFFNALLGGVPITPLHEILSLHEIKNQLLCSWVGNNPHFIENSHFGRITIMHVINNK